jgi:hypothetical protein
MIDEAIGFTVRPINGIEKNTLDNGSSFDCRLGSLDSAIKLRLARCIEISGSIEYVENADAVRLYEEVRQSPYSNGIDRAKSCYRLGRFLYGKAMQNSSMQQRRKKTVRTAFVTKPPMHLWMGMGMKNIFLVLSAFSERLYRIQEEQQRS